MSQRNVNKQTAGFLSLERGMDSGRSPSLLLPNQYALGINTTVRGGFLTHRPGFRKLTLQFVDADGAVDETLQERFEDGRWQGGCYYDPPNATPGLACAIGGRQFVIAIDQPWGTNNAVREITPRLSTDTAGDPHGDISDPTLEQAWLVQAEDYLIHQNGRDKAIIYNGGTARRANAAQKEVPVGTVMAYGLGRLWVARGRNFVAGDIVGGPSGTARLGRRDAVLKFTENEYLNEGGSFRAQADVTGMAFPSNLDTALGEGELTVYTLKGASSVLVPADRDTWKNLSIPLQRVVLKPYGAMSQNSLVEVNGDTFFRSPDGIRSFVMAQRQFGQWGNVPVSREMNRLLTKDDRRLLRHASGCLFDNRLLMTCAGLRDPDHGVYFKGLVALDFDVVSSMGEKLPPAYDGVWTGLNVLQLVSGDFDGIERCFAFVLGAEETIELWELTADDYADRPSETETTRIVWAVETRGYSFEDMGEGVKRLAAGKMWADTLRGTVDYEVKYRPDQHPLWLDWTSWTKKAADRFCPSEETCEIAIPLPQRRNNMQLPSVAGVDEATNNQPLNLGDEFQFRIEVTGSCRLKRMRVRAENAQEQPDGGCPVSDTEELALTGCAAEIFTYELESGVGDGLILADGGAAILDAPGGGGIEQD